MGKLSGKIAVITGGNSGIGLETARLFAKEGAKVVITGRRQKELDEAVKSIGDNVMGVQGDVANLADLDKLYAKVKEVYGRVDIVFANAGLGIMAPLGQITEEHFDKLIDVNMKGLLFTVQKALPLMGEGGSIILNSSVAGSTGVEAFSVYSATKAAVRSFARGWTSDLKKRKIRVNAISPGPIETPIFGKMGLSEAEQKGFGDYILSRSPIGRFGKSEEIATAALFLASDDSSYVTGIELTVDGGLAQV
ncbi:MAG TPA: glucose 1-dehydrogenase [bacterium]|nr:glucose 1-dehydrogenase [bacterium]